MPRRYRRSRRPSSVTGRRDAAAREICRRTRIGRVHALHSERRSLSGRLSSVMPRFSSLSLRFASLLAFVLAIIPAAAAENELSRQREQFPTVWELAKRDPTNSWIKLAAGLENYPLYPYLGLAALQRRIADLKREEVDAFLKAWPNSLPAAMLRDAFLLELAKRRDWKNFRDLYDPAITGRELRCDALQARLALGEKLDFANDVQTLWLSATALPAACDCGKRLGAGSGQADFGAGLAAHRARLGKIRKRGRRRGARSAARRRRAQRSGARGARVARPGGGAQTGIGMARLRRIHVMPSRSRRSNSRDATPMRRNRPGERFRRSSISMPNSADARCARSRWHTHRAIRPMRSRASPRCRPTLGNDTTREWRVRTALAAADFKATLAALEAMPEPQRSDARWRYLRARMLARDGHKTEADALFRALSTEPNFFGFLAADQVDAAYTICATDVAEDAAADAALRRKGGIARALEFFAINRLGEARREWEFAMPPLTPDERRRAIAIAARAGWVDRPVYAFNQGDDMRLYALRFPLAHRDDVVRDSRESGIDPAWAYAIIRAESAFTTDARSGANAYGLMQLLPGTAKQLSKSDNIAYGGTSRPLRPRDEHRARHALSRQGRRALRRQHLARQRRIQRRARGRRSLGQSARFARSRSFHRNDSVQGDARVRLARPRVRGDLRLAPARQGAADLGAAAAHRPGLRNARRQDGAQTGRLPGDATARPATTRAAHHEGRGHRDESESLSSGVLSRGCMSPRAIFGRGSTRICAD